MRVLPFVPFLCLLAAGCAHVADLTGGEKDEVGPALERAVPPNGTVNFRGDRFLLHFNERIQVARVREGLLVSPPLDVPPTLSIARGRDLEVRLNAPLRANATYTFSVGEVVKDLTEGNLAAGVDYVISTGPVLDSLSVAGSVANAFSGKPEVNVLVLLHDASDTSDFRGSRPVYATRTGPDGHFVLRHLREGTYKVAALRDLNTNYRYDLPKEEIAFLDSAVRPSPLDSTARLDLHLFQEASPTQALLEATVTNDRAWRLVFARPVAGLELRDVQRTGGSLAWTPEWSALRDTALLWPSDTTALADGRFEVSTEAGVLDTVRYRPLRPMPFNLAVRVARMTTEPGSRIPLEATRPLSQLDTARIAVRRDSSELPFTLVLDSMDRRRALLDLDLAPGTSATLVLLPKTFHDQYGGTNDTLQIALGRAAEQSTGTLRVNVHSATAPEGDLLLELLDAQDLVLRSTRVASLDQPVIWERIDPGNHGLRLIEDRDRNGHWDTGAYASQRQPERVWHYPDAVNIRAAWDLGVDWTLTDP